MCELGDEAAGCEHELDAQELTVGVVRGLEEGQPLSGDRVLERLPGTCHAALLIRTIDPLGLGSSRTVVLFHVYDARTRIATPPPTRPETDLPVARRVGGGTYSFP